MADVGLLAQQRRALILASVRRDGAVRVADLVEQLGVSDMTVRRDLDALARTGALEKVHGGAVAAPADAGSAASVVEEPEFHAKSTMEAAAKRAMAKAAAAFVPSGGVVAVAAGTSAFAVAAELTAVPGLTVVTNSLPVADQFRSSERAAGQSLLVTGGAPTPSAALVGPLAEQAVSALNFDLLILGAQGVSERAGLTTPNLAEAQTNRALIASARRVLVVADHSKWGIVGLSSFAELDRIDVFVTDTPIHPEARRVLGEHVGELVLVEAERA
ncbi:DeoR/GlpR family DNA-binding transcription regulator [Kitasatospora sp. NPDC054939]